MNIQFLVVALVIGRSVDWIFQSQTQAVNKSHDYWQIIYTLLDICSFHFRINTNGHWKMEYNKRNFYYVLFYLQPILQLIIEYW